MEKTYEFEIHFNDQEMVSSVGALDIIEAIYSVLNNFKETYNVDLEADNFILIGEYYA